ncbi:MAG TPA: universal stress protein [Propionibacteriaceae bacterium]|jgi:nucleotide-binding universal stress UspA family protein|nr:universal stress protein [Propionibacteriaceae bacterium]
MSETIQSPSDRGRPGQAELPTQSLPAEAQPLIVVGYSAKPEGRAALQRALSEAKLRGAALVVVDTSPEVETDDLAAELGASGVSYEIRTPADVHDSAEELIRIAETTAADFIVIGLRRRSPVGKLLLGSNAQRVLLDAACPVLAVKAEPGAG